ncbi:hypothetical protein TIFTF001_039792 [Ficus carica]|uniref:Uncharacterized protein n=1 Tax=Ficus carica TaxID=3494 RepID=A0AA87YWH8_FICCA|nr:hypothetical protein TIFTF001_039792 [Ficus carica]
MPKQPLVQLDHCEKKANNKEDKSAAREGHTPPMTDNPGPRTDPTPSPPPCSPALVIFTSPHDGSARIRG